MPVDASKLTATLDDSMVTGVVIPLNSDVDDYGVIWRMQTIDGWDSPDLPEAAEARPSQDGMWDALNFYSGRQITIGGKLTAPSYEAREAAEYRLRQIVVRDRLVPFTVNETTPKWVSGRRSGRLMIRPVTDTISELGINLLCPDPRKYGTDPVAASISVADGLGGLAPPWTPPVLLPAITTSPAEVTLDNAGIYESPPTIIIRGPGTDIEVHNFTTGRHLAYDLVLGAADYILVDVASGVGLLNGSAIRAPKPGSSITGLFLMEPGPNLMRILGTLTDVVPPSADITFYPAWT